MTSLAKSLISLLSVLLCFTYCSGQVKSGPPPARETKHALNPKLTGNQGSDEGQNVHCGLQDKNGDLWFGTTGAGLYRYDGKSFTNFTTKDGLSSNVIWS